MAILKSITKSVLGESLTFPQAYHEVVVVSGDKQEMNAQIAIYKDSTKEIVVDTIFHTFTPDISEHSKNNFAQAYDSIKLSPEYENSIDC